MRYNLRTAPVPTRRETIARSAMPAWHGIFFLILLWLALPVIARSEEAADKPGTSGRLSEIVRDLCERLQITDHVEVQIDENNSRMVSSEPLAGTIRGYRISFDREFLESLDETEITAAIAHELGHVWIYTHHPYLQTEELANEIAMRAIARDSMKKIYAKLWAHTGVTGNLDELLGPEPALEKPKTAALKP